MKTYGEWRYTSTILDLNTSEVSGQFYAPDALPPGKEPPVPTKWGSESVWSL
jgi:hypothetical protein